MVTGFESLGTFTEETTMSVDTLIWTTTVSEMTLVDIFTACFVHYPFEAGVAFTTVAKKL